MLTTATTELKSWDATKCYQSSCFCSCDMDYGGCEWCGGFTCCLAWHVLLYGKPQINVVSAATPDWPSLLLQLSPERHCNSNVLHRHDDYSCKSSKYNALKYVGLIPSSYPTIIIISHWTTLDYICSEMEVKLACNWRSQMTKVNKCCTVLHLVCVYIEISSASGWLEALRTCQSQQSHWRFHVQQLATSSVHTDTGRQHRGHDFSAMSTINKH